MSSGEGLTLINGQCHALHFDGDTSTEGSASPDTLIHHDGGLNVNAPIFNANSIGAPPVIITKNVVDIGNERWKPTATVVEELPMPPPDLPQPFIGADGFYYIPTDMVGNFAPVVVEQLAPATSDTAETFQTTEIVAAPAAAPPVVETKDLPVDELKRLVQLQFEYYFSRENLANDSYLVSQMDGDSYVPISTMSKFNQIRKLTSDMNLIVQALKESPYVQLDDTGHKVRANKKRCIVILREIPESTPIEEVKALFDHPNCPKWSSFEFAHNDSWYVTFECEDDAKLAYQHLREEVQSFQGRPLMARIKAKTLLSRTVYLPKPANANAANPNTANPTIETVLPTTFQPLTNAAFQPQVFSTATPQEFQYYQTVPANGAPPFLSGTWLGPRHQIIQPLQEIRNNKSNFVKHNGYSHNKNGNQNTYYNKPRYPFRNNYNHNNNKNNDERQPRNNRNNLPNGNHPMNNNGNHHMNNNGSRGEHGSSRGDRDFKSNRDDARFSRRGGDRGGDRGDRDNKKERASSDEIPRFQRLRERKSKEEIVPLIPVQATQQELSLDLAPENFPALPSPNSPVDNMSTNSQCSSLKELASNALGLAEDKLSADSSPTTISDLSETSPLEQTSSDSDLLLRSTNISPVAKISYAQMAQKPQNNAKIAFDSTSEEKDFQTAVNGTVTIAEDKQSKSPRKANSTAATSTATTAPKTTDSQSQCVVCEPKDTYASKFSNKTNTRQNTKAPNVAVVVNNKNNAPRPLMSQIIKPPESKLNEIKLAIDDEAPVRGVAQWDEIKPAVTSAQVAVTTSFSDTVRNVASHADGNNKENEEN